MLQTQHFLRIPTCEKYKTLENLQEGPKISHRILFWTHLDTEASTSKRHRSNLTLPTPPMCFHPSTCILPRNKQNKYCGFPRLHGQLLDNSSFLLHGMRISSVLQAPINIHSKPKVRINGERPQNVLVFPERQNSE